MSWTTCKRRILAVWRYFAASWEGTDGLFSYRRASQFLWSFGIMYIIVSARLQGGMGKYDLWSLIVLAILWIYTAGMLSFEQLFRLVKLTAPLKLMEAENDPPGRTDENPPDPEISGPEVEILEPKT